MFVGSAEILKDVVPLQSTCAGLRQEVLSPEKGYQTRRLPHSLATNMIIKLKSSGLWKVPFCSSQGHFQGLGFERSSLETL